MSRSWLLLSVLALLALALFAAPSFAHEAEAEDALADFELEFDGFDADAAAMLLETEAEGEDALEAETEAEAEAEDDSFAELDSEMEAESEQEYVSLLQVSSAKRYSYSQRSGVFTFPDGRKVQSYSGKGAEINNPAKQCVSNRGPLPRGTYTIGPRHRHATTGPDSLRLTPSKSNAMCGRAGFLIHGGSFATAKTGPSSQGCIIMPVADRRRIVAGGILTVTV